MKKNPERKAYLLENSARAKSTIQNGRSFGLSKMLFEAAARWKRVLTQLIKNFRTDLHQPPSYAFGALPQISELKSKD